MSDKRFSLTFFHLLLFAAAAAVLFRSDSSDSDTFFCSFIRWLAGSLFLLLFALLTAGWDSMNWIIVMHAHNAQITQSKCNGRFWIDVGIVWGVYGGVSELNRAESERKRKKNHKKGKKSHSIIESNTNIDSILISKMILLQQSFNSIDFRFRFRKIPMSER